MTAITSASAYFEIIESGLVKKLHKDIARAMFCNITDPGVPTSMTGSEIAHEIKRGRDHVSPRMPELLALGVVKRGARRRCKVTGFSCQTWELTGSAPVVPAKRHFMKCDHCGGKGKTEIFGVEQSR